MSYNPQIYYPGEKGTPTYSDAVVEGDPSQSEGLEQLWRLGAIRLRVCGSSRWGFLSGSEVGDAWSRLVDDIGNLGARHVGLEVGCAWRMVMAEMRGKINQAKNDSQRSN